jgi:hypothetical protein
MNYFELARKAGHFKTEHSKNNNTHPDSAARCRCGRYITSGEIAGGVRTYNYVCPTCYQKRMEDI